MDFIFSASTRLPLAIFISTEPGKRSQLVLIVAAMALIALVLGVTLPSRPKILEVLNDLAHAPALGAFALIVLRLVRLWRPADKLGGYGIAFLTAVGVGALIEVVQSFIDRDASLGDLETDTLGAACVLGFVAAFDRRLWSAAPRATGRIACATLAILCGLWALLPLGQAAVAYLDRARAFPVVAQFAASRDLYFFSSGTARLSLQPLPDRWAQPGDALSLRVESLANTLWPGVSHDEPQPDWRGFSTLLLDVTNPTETPLDLGVRVHDLTHNQDYNDRFTRAFELAPSSRAVLRIPIKDIVAGPVDRLLDLAHIAGIVVFKLTPAASDGERFYLSRIWLE